MLSKSVSGAVALLCICVMATLAQTRPVTMMDLATLKNIGGLSISPSGRYVIYQVYRANPHTNEYSNQWMLSDTRTEATRTLIADGGAPILTYEDHTTDVMDYQDDWASFAPIWSSDEKFYYVRKDNGEISIHQHAITGTDHIARGIIGNIIDFHQLDSTHALITTLAPTNATKAAALAAQRNGILFFGSSPESDFDPSRGIPDMHPEKIQHYFGLDLRHGAVFPLRTPPTAFADENNNRSSLIPGMRFSLLDTLAPDRRHRAFIPIYVRNGGFESALYISSVDNKRVAQLVPRSSNTTHGIESLKWSADSRRIFYLQETDRVNADLFVVDIASKKIQRLTHTHAELGNCTFSQDTQFATCMIESALRPPNVFYIDLLTGKTKTLNDLNPTFEQLVQTMRARTLAWTNKWGDKFFGQLVYPRQYRHGVRYPLVVLTYHGSGFQRGGSGDEYPILPLAAQGFFVLSVELHGSDAYDEVKSKAGIFSVMHWQSPLDGIEQIIRKLSTDGLIDEHEVGIGGLSYGTEMALYAISHSRMFRAASVSNGGSARDPFFYYLKNKSWDQEFKKWGLDGPPYGANFANWRLLSPALRASQTNAALLMNAPDSDYLAGLQQYWEMRDHHKPVEMWIYSDAAHVKYQPAQRLSIYNRNIDWFRFWLQGYEDPDPAKRGQYSRWNKLRAESSNS